MQRTRWLDSKLKDGNDQLRKLLVSDPDPLSVQTRRACWEQQKTKPSFAVLLYRALK